MEVIRDCTGDYLRNKKGKDFFVCNEAILDSFITGEEIEVEYDVMEQCFGLMEPTSCSELHSYENKIDVTKIY